MNNYTLKHKCYEGSVEFCEESKVWHGKVLDTHHLVTYEGDTPEQLKHNFELVCEDLWDTAAKLAAEEEAKWREEEELNDKRVMRHLKRISKPKVYDAITSFIKDTYMASGYSIVDVKDCVGDRVKMSEYIGESSPIKYLYLDGSYDYYGESWGGDFYLWIGGGKYFKMYGME